MCCAPASLDTRSHDHDCAAAPLCHHLAVSERHLVRVVAQLSKPLGLVMEFAEGQPIAEKPNLEVGEGAAAAQGQQGGGGWGMEGPEDVIHA